jgi:uncharacterized membrane protein
MHDLSILLFTTIDLLRNELAKTGPFWWMVWNASLALIPAFLAIFFFKRTEQPRNTLSTLVFSVELGFVLLFLPNAPYVATDLVHFLENVRNSDHSLWSLLATEFPIYCGFVFLGLASYSFTEDRMLFALKRRFGKRGYTVGLVSIPLLCAIGIYLGRVARVNSWDILNKPLSIARSGGSAMSDLRMAKVILSMALLLFLVHQAYKLFHDGIRYRRAVRKASMRMDSQKLGHASGTLVPMTEKP